MILGDLIKKYREQNNLSLRDFADITGLSYSYIGMLEKNYNYKSKKPLSPTLESMQVIAKGMGLTLDELLDILDDEQPIKINSKNIEDDSLETVPIVGLITAGQPILATESIEGYLPIDPTIYGKKNVKDLFFLKVKGNSMNLKVQDGDYALIQKQDYADNNDIIVAIVNGDNEATLKKYKRLNDQFVMLEPMSTESFEPIMVDLKTTKLEIIGKAIGHFGKL